MVLYNMQKHPTVVIKLNLSGCRCKYQTKKAESHVCFMNACLYVTNAVLQVYVSKNYIISFLNMFFYFLVYNLELQQEVQLSIYTVAVILQHINWLMFTDTWAGSFVTYLCLFHRL